jgi:hypothetical protein
MRPECSFVFSTDGTCSICDRDRARVQRVLGVADRPTRVCDQCVALGWDLVADEVGVETPSDLHGRVNFDDVPFDDAQYQAHIAEVSRRLAEEREARRVSPFDPARVAQARAATPKFRCSFCDAHRADSIKLVAGRGGFICDACIGDATVVIVGALHS